MRQLDATPFADEIAEYLAGRPSFVRTLVGMVAAGIAEGPVGFAHGAQMVRRYRGNQMGYPYVAIDDPFLDDWPVDIFPGTDEPWLTNPWLPGFPTRPISRPPTEGPT